jgi:hypothetical protein
MFIHQPIYPNFEYLSCFNFKCDETLSNLFFLNTHFKWERREQQVRTNNIQLGTL